MSHAHWIEEAESRGRETLQEVQRGLKLREERQRKFAAEVVTEESVRQYLEPFVIPMQIVADELQAHGYGVKDEGYKYEMYTSQPEHFALTEKRQGDGSQEYNVVYGRVFTINTPFGGQKLDTLGIVSMVNDRTHFGRVLAALKSGGGIFIDSPEHVVEAVADLRQLIGSRIATCVSTGHSRT